MISLIINTFNEPYTIGKAIESFVKQNINERYELLVVCPDKKTIGVIKKYVKIYPQVKHIKDEGRGKSLALNKILSIAKGRILILSDGDVFVSDNSVNSILEIFRDEKIGCVSGRPVSLNSRRDMFGYWSHLLFYGAHRIRKLLFEKGEFLECSGYLFAFRNKVIKNFPVNVAEDTIIPYLFFIKGYKIGYAEKALVNVKNPANIKDWVKQKKRTIKAHEILKEYAKIKNITRVKSFRNEVEKGFLWSLPYPKNIKEVIWTIALFVARLYVWISTFIDIKFRKKTYKDSWERVESTK